MWVDPNLNDFYSRVARIEKSHAKGYGFEAVGTVSKPVEVKRGWRVMRLVKPLVFAVVAGLALKGTIHYYIGAQAYESRVSALATGTGVDQVGAWLMKADPVTLWVSGQLHGLLQG